MGLFACKCDMHVYCNMRTGVSCTILEICIFNDTKTEQIDKNLFLSTILTPCWYSECNGAAILNWKLAVVEIPLTFGPEISTLGGVCDDASGWERGKSDFWVKLKKCCGFGHCQNCQGFKTLKTGSGAGRPEYSKTSWGRIMIRTVMLHSLTPVWVLLPAVFIHSVHTG